MNRDLSQVPEHIAIIPDGNRRWAKERSLKSVDGHKKGAEITRAVALAAAKKGVRYLSIWGMSMDNIKKRSPVEIAGLLGIFQRDFKELAVSDDIHSLEVKIHVIGHWQKAFPERVKSSIQQAITATQDYSKHHLVFFLVYNGTDEMLSAIQKLVDSSENKKSKITAKLLKEQLLTKDLPPVDLLIRTGGEPHLSNGFMMWDTADSELYFTEKYWPDFNETELDAALADFAHRRRNKGK